jgi:hypothetical protein
MIVLFAVVFVHTYRTSKIPFIMGLSVLFMISNVCNLTQNLIGDVPGGFPYRLLFLALAQSTMNSGHWWFCFEYLECAISLSFRIKNAEVPKVRRHLIKTVFIVLMIVQAVMPLAYCFLIYAYYEHLLGLTLNSYKLVVKLFMTMWTISLVG